MIISDDAALSRQMRGSRAASGAGGRGRLDPRPLAQPDRRGDRRDQHHAGERVQRRVHAGGRGERRQRERRERRAGGHGRLPEPEREPALVAREPAEHGPSARRDPGRAEHAGERHPRRAAPRTRASSRPRTSRATRRRAPTAMIARSPRAVGGHAPGEQRHDRADRERREDRRDLHEREVERVLDRRRHRRQPALHRRQRGGRERAHAQHHPAIAEAAWRKGHHPFESRRAYLDGRTGFRFSGHARSRDA